MSKTNTNTNTNRSEMLLNKFERYLVKRENKVAAIQLNSVIHHQQYLAEQVDVLFGVLELDYANQDGLSGSSFSPQEKMELNIFCTQNGIEHYFDILDDDFKGIDFNADLTLEKNRLKAREIKAEIESEKEADASYTAKDQFGNKLGEKALKKSESMVQMTLGEHQALEAGFKDVVVGKTSRVVKEKSNKKTNGVAEKKIDRSLIKASTPKVRYTLNRQIAGLVLAWIGQVFKDVGYKGTTSHQVKTLVENAPTVIAKIRRTRAFGEYLKMNGMVFDNVELEVVELDDPLNFLIATVNDQVIVLDTNWSGETMNIIFIGTFNKEVFRKDCGTYVKLYMKQGYVEGASSWK